MNYYEVLVATPRYHGSEALTYCSTSSLPVGAVVAVPLQNETVAGIVTARTTKPHFAAKEIQRPLTTNPVPAQLLKLITWLQLYYPAPLGSITQLFVPSTLLQTTRTRATPKNPPTQPSATLPPLNPEQVAAVQAIMTGKHSSHLLHGITGSGKTRVYLELALKNIEQSRSVLLLTPEIGLTPQLTQLFSSVFGDKIVVFHSTLSAAQRREAWKRVNESTEPLIIIGPRSALFTPAHRVGLIILDEAHDSAYKQEQAPYYQATRVAASLAKLHQAKLVLGSATPNVADYYAFQTKQLPILELRSKAITANHASEVQVIDLKDRANFTRSPWISSVLLQAISQSIQEQSQTLLFLNRRGTARIVLCKDCGWQASCPRCDLPLTYHGDIHALRCHTCGYVASMTTSCPTCGNTEIVFRSIGTKTVTEELSRLFPKARIKRFDSDNSRKESLEHNYDSVRAGNFDIIIGTQMLAKGLDLPNLSTVGVLLADTSLQFPDYTAQERTYQLLNQVVGRTGRGHGASRVIIQTYSPSSPLLHAALKGDYASFYANEIQERSQYGFPPFRHLAKLSITKPTQKTAQKHASACHEQLITAFAATDLEVSGPMPAFTEKRNNTYTWQIVLRAKSRATVVRAARTVPKGWIIDIDPANLL